MYYWFHVKILDILKKSWSRKYQRQPVAEIWLMLVRMLRCHQPGRWKKAQLSPKKSSPAGYRNYIKMTMKMVMKKLMSYQSKVKECTTGYRCVHVSCRRPGNGILLISSSALTFILCLTRCFLGIDVLLWSAMYFALQILLHVLTWLAVTCCRGWRLALSLRQIDRTWIGTW